MSPQAIPSPPSLRGHLLAILSGTLLTLSFSSGYPSLAAWVGLIPLLLAIRGASLSGAFRLGLISGLAHCLTLLYWIIVVLEHYGNLHILVALAALLLLSLYLSLYPALFAGLASRLPDFPSSPFLLASYWVSLEYLKAHLLTGFPWCLMGYSQYERLPLIQAADLCGVYGISFLIVLVNGVLFRASLWVSTGSGRFRTWELLAPALILGATWGYGHHRITGLHVGGEGGPDIKTAVVQGNINQSVKWDPAYQEKTVHTYERLTRSAEPYHPDLIVWPETALPFYFQEASRLSQEIVSLAETLPAALVFGSPAYERQGRSVRYTNRAYLLAPAGREILYYDKNHLVPFGEYVPLKRYLPFVRRLVEAAGDFAPGKRVSPLRTGDLSLGILICFEAIFPDLARALVRGGANVLVNLTNDAWFGRTSAPYQHLRMAVFRAIENRRPMIRAANTGFSAVVTPIGAVSSQSDLFVEEVLVDRVKPRSLPVTFYTRFGDLFARVLLVISVLGVVSRRLMRRGRIPTG